MKLFFYLIFILSLRTESSTTEVTDKDIVKNLHATLTSDKTSIELNWKEPDEDGDIIIARSNELIDSFEKLAVSDSLGKYKSEKKSPFNSFRDTNLKSGTYFYAIVQVSQVKKKKTKLFPNQNFTTVGVIVPPRTEIVEKPEIIIETKHLVSEISNLRLRQQDNTIRLTWTPPLEAEYTEPLYTVYRSLNPLNKQGMFDKAEKLAELSHPETTYLDVDLKKSETFYYAVTVSLKEKEYFDLEENQGYRKIYFVYNEEEKLPTKIVEEKKEIKFLGPLKISDLKYEKLKTGILLNWKAPENATTNASIYTIYESEETMQGKDSALLNGKAKKIGIVVHPDTQFLHPINSLPKDLYYGVTVSEKDITEDKNLVENISFVKIGKSKKKKKKPAETKEEIKPTAKEQAPIPIETEKVIDSDFDSIYKNSFKKEKFKMARVKFLALADKTEDKNLKAKSMFFAALCHYYKKEYEKALKILLKDIVQLNYDKERVDFYTKRCLERR